MIVFARTKLATDELAQKLQARGFSAAAINGDVQQAQRERTIQQLKDGKIDILIATDVAARGLDVDRISHVVNYDVPYDTESYVHRIGRTGRAGRSGEAILFIAPRERNLLRSIERATRQPIEPMELPTVEAINDVRIAKFKQQITDTLEAGGLELFQRMIEEYEQAHDVPAIEVAAALAKMFRGDVPMLLKPEPKRERPQSFDERHAERGERPQRAPRFDNEGERSFRERPAFPKKERVARAPDAGMQTFRIEVGYDHGVKPGNIVGAVANEAGLEAKHIGRIEIFEDYSLVDLPEGMPQDTMTHLKTVWCAGQQLRITKDGTPPDTAGKKPAGPRHPGSRPAPFNAGRKPFGPKKDFGERKPFKPKPKPHRKGPRPE
jgi:ATP-dependent RNA helicase DeaD